MDEQRAPRDVLALINTGQGFAYADALNQQVGLIDRYVDGALGSHPFASSLKVRRGPGVRLADGTSGYYARRGRGDDCFAAALATCLQVPIGQVPDPRIDERLAAGESADEIEASAWQALGEWLEARGFRMVEHAEPASDRERWIGVVPFPGNFNAHCLVMARGKVLSSRAAARSRRNKPRLTDHPRRLVIPAALTSSTSLTFSTARALRRRLRSDLLSRNVGPARRCDPGGRSARTLAIRW